MQLQHDRNHASPAFCTTPDEVHDFIAYAVAHYNVDPERIYVTGLSCGAFGIWEYLAKYGDEQVAAAVPIAGDGRPAWATAGCGLGSVADLGLPRRDRRCRRSRGSIEPMTNLAGCPGVPADRARLTVYPDLTHDGWDQAYSGSLGDDIYTWMLGSMKPSRLAPVRPRDVPEYEDPLGTALRRLGRASATASEELPAQMRPDGRAGATQSF